MLDKCISASVTTTNNIITSKHAMLGIRRGQGRCVVRAHNAFYFLTFLGRSSSARSRFRLDLTASTTCWTGIGKPGSVLTTVCP